MGNETMLKNKPVPELLEKIIGQHIGAGNYALIAVVSDLGLNGKYGSAASVFTSDSVIAADPHHEDGCIVMKYSEIDELTVKRMFGNAVLRAKKHDGSFVNLMRFTYSVADLCDACSNFVEKVNEGEDIDEQLEIVRHTFSKLRCFCPKCGRKLEKPDAPCLNCQGKGKMISVFFKYVKPQLPRLAACLFLSIATTALSLVPPYITGIMVDDVIPDKNIRMLTTVILYLLGSYALQYFLGAIRAYVLRVAGASIIVDLKKDVYKKAQYLPMSYYDKTTTGSVINRVNGDTSVLQNFMLIITQDAVVQFFMLIGLVIIMMVMDWKLTLISLAPVPVVVALGKLFGKRIAPMYRRLWRRGTALYSILCDTIPGIRVIKAFTNEQSVIDRFSRNTDDWLKEDKRAGKTASIFPNLMTFLITCGTVLIWFIGGRWVINDDSALTLGLLVAFVSYASMFYTPVNFFANLNNTYQNALASAEKILDILRAEPEENFGAGKKLKRIDGKIEFRNVNFAFDRSKKALDNINLTINPGDIVGIVGTTGSGKTTLINLIMRYYSDYDGEILVDDVNIRDIDIDFYRSQIGYVQQEPVMFKDTIFNNIAYNNNNIPVEAVINAADIANAHPFIAKLPEGYDTLIGERGIGLSGGERQRLSIARAVLKNPSIMILDEATAAVDSETESLIQEAIERLIRGRTTIMIAHRLSTLRKANKIVVVDKGKIIECGTPEELMALKGKYYKLIQIQSMSEKVMEQKRSENFE